MLADKIERRQRLFKRVSRIIKKLYVQVSVYDKIFYKNRIS